MKRQAQRKREEGRHEGKWMLEAEREKTDAVSALKSDERPHLAV